MASVRLDLDPNPDRMVSGQVEIFRGQRRDSHAIDKRAVARHAPALQHPVLTALQLPPVGRIKTAPIAEIARTGPHSELAPVDRDGDVGGPVRSGPGNLRRQFERDLERGDGFADVPGVVGKLVLDEAAREPHEAGIHSVGIEECPRHIEQADDFLGRAEATRRAHFAAGVESDRHRDLDRVGANAADIVAEHDQHLVKGGEAELLMAFPTFPRFRSNEAGVLENLQVGRDCRLRKVQGPGNVVDIDAWPAMQETQHARPRWRSQSAQHVRSLRGIDHQEIARHSPPASLRDFLYQLFGCFDMPAGAASFPVNLSETFRGY